MFIFNNSLFELMLLGILASILQPLRRKAANSFTLWWWLGDAKPCLPGTQNNLSFSLY